MAVLYLEPEDLTPAQAARVLDFLNRAASADEIATRVEFPGERDIGVRLAQRLLDARAALAGTFTDLRQVAAVPLIGPERFTELCAAVLGLDPRRWLHDFSAFAGGQSQGADGADRKLAAPHGASERAQLDAAAARQAARLGQASQPTVSELQSLSERVQLDLTATPQPAWLGQALQLTVSVSDLRGRPVPNRQVTVEASAGVLEAAYGFAVQRARALSVRTGADGTARLRLRFATIEPLTADQQAALEEVLGQLDAGADSPNLLRDAFMGIAAAYQDERRQALRGALDIYARQWKAQFFDQINPSSLGFDWPLETCVVRVDCHPADGGRAGVAGAVLIAHWKNWVGAWFEFLGEYLTQQAKLRTAFAGAKRRGASGYRLVDDLLGEAYSFVADQKGLAAEWLSQRVVKYAMNDFLGREVDNVDDATQRELFSSLEAAANQITRTSRGAIAMVSQTRADLDDKITKVGGINVGVLDEVRGLHAEMLARAGQVGEQLAGFTATKAQLDQRLGQFDSRFQTFTTQFNDFGERYSTFKVDYGEFRNRYDDLGGRLNVFDQNFAAFDSRYTQFNTDLAGFRTERTQLTQDVNAMRAELNTVKTSVRAVEDGLGTVKAEVTAVKTDMGSVRTDVTGLKKDLGTVRDDISVIKIDVGKVRTDFAAVNTDLATVRTDVSGLKTDLGTVRTDISGIKTDLGKVRTDFVTVNTGLSTVQTDVAGLKSELGTVRTDVADVKTDLGKVRTDITAVNSGLTTVRTDVTGLKTELGTVRTDVTAVRTDLGTVKQNVNTINVRLPPGTGRIG